MRSDMPAVVTNLARAGSDNPSMKTGRRVVLDADGDYDSPLRISGGLDKVPLKIEKRSGIRYAPLRRFLHSRVGQPWDQVYSEIRHAFSHRSKSVHILECVMRMVDLQCINGQPRFLATFYVDPTTRLLCYQPPKRSDSPIQRLDRLTLKSNRFVVAQYQDARGEVSEGGTRLPFNTSLWVAGCSHIVLRKHEGIWYIDYHRSLNPETIIRVVVRRAIVLRRRGDCPNEPQTFLHRTKQASKAEVREILWMIQVL